MVARTMMIHCKISEIHGSFFHFACSPLKHFALELREIIDILEEPFWRGCLPQIHSHLKETKSTFSIPSSEFFHFH